MNKDPDQQDKKEARTLALVLIAMLAVLVGAAVLMLPLAADLVGDMAAHMAPGLGLKQAAIIAFSTTVVLMIVFAIAAGDGFLGEIQFMLLGFFLFFVVIWLLLAWIF